MAYADKDDFEKIQEKVDEHSQKLAQCRLEEHKKDHDNLTVMMEKCITMSDKMKNLNQTHVNLTNQMNETAGNLNMIAEKVSTLSNDRSSRKKFFTAIISGIVISVLSGLLVLWVTFTFSTLNKKTTEHRDKQMEVLMQTVETRDKQMGLLIQSANDRDKQVSVIMQKLDDIEKNKLVKP
jgi:hypothetical protein